MSKKKPTLREQIAELEAELAGCEARIEELEAKNAALQKRVDEGDFGAVRELHDAREELRTTLRDLHTTSTDRDGWKSTAQSLAKIVHKDGDKYFAPLEKTESQRAHEDLVAEVEKWKSKAAREGDARWRAECDRDKYKGLLADARGANMRAYEMGKREARDQQRIGGIVRRAVRRALEVVR